MLSLSGLRRSYRLRAPGHYFDGRPARPTIRHPLPNQWLKATRCPEPGCPLAGCHSKGPVGPSQAPADLLPNRGEQNHLRGVSRRQPASTDRAGQSGHWPPQPGPIRAGDGSGDVAPEPRLDFPPPPVKRYPRGRQAAGTFQRAPQAGLEVRLQIAPGVFSPSLRGRHSRADSHADQPPVIRRPEASRAGAFHRRFRWGRLPPPSSLSSTPAAEGRGNVSNRRREPALCPGLFDRADPRQFVAPRGSSSVAA